MYVIELKISEEDKKRGFKPLIYTTEHFEFKGDLLVFQDKFNNQMIINKSEVKMIREQKNKG
jgi:hypothetical protein